MVDRSHGHANCRPLVFVGQRRETRHRLDHDADPATAATRQDGEPRTARKRSATKGTKVTKLVLGFSSWPSWQEYRAGGGGIVLCPSWLHRHARARFRLIRWLLLQLQLIQFGIRTAAGQQFVVRSDLDDAAPLENDDGFGPAHRRQPI